MANDKTYFGEGNSKGRVLKYDFEYCLGCNMRFLDGKPVTTHDILEHELERLVMQAKHNNYVAVEETTAAQRFRRFGTADPACLAFGRLKDAKP